MRWFGERSKSVDEGGGAAGTGDGIFSKLHLPVSGCWPPLPSAVKLDSLLTCPSLNLNVSMPSSLRTRKGWCGCLQDAEPPEITYCVVEQAGTLSLTPTQPMPAPEELNAKFAELVEELDLTAPNKAAMLSLPPEKKWQIYCSKKKDQEGETDLSHLPEHYIERVKALAMLQFPTVDADDEVRSRTRQLDALKTALRTQPHSFVLRFVELDGLPALLSFLGGMDYQTAQSSVHTSLIGCVKALMNNSNGRAHVLAHPTAIDTIAQSLSTENVKTKIAVLEILGAVCLVPGGHRKVLQAMLHYQAYAAERTRFQGIVNDLDRSTGIYRDEVNLKTAIMSFVNAVLNYGPGQENLEFRLHLRYEFLMLGIQPVIDKLRGHENETLDRHLDFFEMVRNEDEKELARKFEKEHIDTKSATAMFDLLRRKLSHTAAYPHLLSLLHHCILLPLDYGSHPQHWLLFDRIVQQLVLQGENSNNPDVAPLQINVKELVHLLAKEEELVAARNRADELEKENADLASRLAKKEQELDLRLQEKEDMETNLQRVKERLEKETAAHLEMKQRCLELEDRACELDRQVASERGERHRLEQLVSSGSLPDDAKVVGLRSGLGDGYDNRLAPTTPPDGSGSPAPPPPPPPPLSDTPEQTQSLSSSVPPPPPPQAPPTAPPPVPVPPPTPRPEKNVPQPSNPLKSFNWSKLPDAKVTGTIWSELDDSKLYMAMDLESIDKLFCAYQKNGITNEGSVEDLSKLGKNRTKVISVIDGRRAQNCTILLSKLKMSDEEISRAILSMDSRDQLPIDMVEQLLKFTPSAEEAALLEEHAEEIDSLARADRFLYEISKIGHYEQRLRSLHYKKRFTTSVCELEPRVRAVLEASREVARSRRLRRLLEVVLALGNYMNRGARGNARGFRLASLNRLADTRSSAARGTTLLHYLVEVLDKKFKDILKLDEDLPHVREAAKVSMGELEKDMSALRGGLKEVEREIEFHRSQASVVPGDRFLPIMREFLSSATCRFSELEDLFQDMKTRFDRAVRLFGEDNAASVQPDEFFGIFDAFLNAFNEAHQDNENLRRRREEEERRAIQEAELKKRTIERKSSRESILARVGSSLRNGLNNGTVPGPDGRIAIGLRRRESDSAAKGEFDDLISALRTGDVFSDDVAKFKRSRKARMNGSPPGSSVDGGRERVVTAVGGKTRLGQ
ncbi:disheveled-associated activator of morphogenesis 1 [Schistocerca nitens]|uniref:disheveled-associated activator of morphogenesis 1 n=1 Tax=Schistocerca nitens TaxID=7011 RepID=UPI00211768AA|nr:disheveled-associated activator of morphogenesis 1 [Schistocerca nitens]